MDALADPSALLIKTGFTATRRMCFFDVSFIGGTNVPVRCFFYLQFI